MTFSTFIHRVSGVPRLCMGDKKETEGALWRHLAKCPTLRVDEERRGHPRGRRSIPAFQMRFFCLNSCEIGTTRMWSIDGFYTS